MIVTDIPREPQPYDPNIEPADPPWAYRDSQVTAIFCMGIVIGWVLNALVGLVI